jgi:methionyl-tRNA formyltransferase
MTARVVFMGSPEYAIPSLNSLWESYDLVGIVTQPDKPAGRNQVLTPPPVKIWALDKDIPFIQPTRLRDTQAMEQLHTWNPDIIIVAAFGQILRKDVLTLPFHGCVNVHASLLPRWRGAAPIQAAILNGDPITGVTIMQMDPGIDTGPILSQRSLEISGDDTSLTISQKLAVLGAELLIDTLPGYLQGTTSLIIQDENLATYAPMIKKEEGILDFSNTSTYLANMVRAYIPWPGTYTIWQGQVFKVLRAHAVSISDSAFPQQIGRRTVYQGLPAFSTQDGYLVLDEVQPAGKKPINAKSFLQGARNWEEHP